MTIRKIVVLGGGLVGGPMALDLAKDSEFEVTVVDINEGILEGINEKDKSIGAIKGDLSNAEKVKSLVREFDLVLNAVPGFMGYETLKTVIEAGKNAVDIAFFPEDCFGLDALAKSKGVTAIVDCGVAPGLSNLLAGHVNSMVDELRSVLIYVGGLPEVRTWPYEYKAVFSPIDVIEEYTRPARYIENGALVTRTALSDPELLEFPGMGTLEAFNTDGLRTLADTIKAPNLKEKTLRYPGHIQKMAVLRETGFFDQEEITVRGTKIRPIDLTAALLFPKWKLEKGEVDITVMQVVIEGMMEKKLTRYTYDLLDRYDAETDTHSMARTTGYTATAAVRMFAKGLYAEPGIAPPELIGKHSNCFDFILACLKERNIVCEEKIEEIAT